MPIQLEKSSQRYPLEKAIFCTYNCCEKKSHDTAMLKEFTIKNFKSINQEATISMEADVERVSEHPEHITYIRDNALLRVCSMYGPNGGGKSNVLKALGLLPAIVMAGSVYEGIPDYSHIFSDNNVSEFTVFFAAKTHDIGYKLRFKTAADASGTRGALRWMRGETKFNIVSEEINALNPSTGEYETYCVRDEAGVIDSPIESVAKAFANRPAGSSTSVIRLFRDYFYNENRKTEDEFEVLFELYSEIGKILALSDPSPSNNVSIADYLLAQGHKQELIRLLKAADINIADIEVENEGNQATRIYFIRRTPGHEERKAIELREESMGTQKLFSMLARFLAYRDGEAIFLADDLNAYLHPKLLSAVIDLFNNNINGRSQLIFNSHDIVNMNNRMFRRDEIWFVYRDENYQTSIVPLSNITNYKGKQIRNDASYGKQYLEGKYGADPFIEKGLSWNE